ncbi:cysteine desulfurase family protein [Fulvivirga sediminis]|uniref:cysteine desulfurase n=1 Tax=Fulvivirga sediminis TaxID=2803949 RepID=A0A937JZS0_9BACT|nr:cysteine desulfurase family protein [Fulvivirga sediminis]MBL3657653.1 cysteine desulfurase [Fulvivirga sediminis]
MDTKNKKLYLDYSATTPVDPQVLQAMLPYFTESFGNASSASHVYGWDAEEAVETAREQVAELIGAKSKQIIFTSGSTESINIALQGVASNKGHIITCATEHNAVLRTCKTLENSGTEITLLGVNEKGNIDLNELEAAIQPNTELICIMAVNNETGVIHPIKSIGEIAKKHHLPLVVDATQAVGKIGFNIEESGADLVALSSHKIYGPKGIGALYIAKRMTKRLKPFLSGGTQEKGLRPGTLNVPGIVGMGKACELALNSLNEEYSRVKKLQKKLEKGILAITGSKINGYQTDRSPYITNIVFEGVLGEKVIRKLKHIAISQGSACTSNTVEPSHVLSAMHIPEKLALSAIRISIGKFTSAKDIDIAIQDITDAVNALRKVNI